MGQQIKRVLKRRRRKAYLTRKNEQVKLGLKPKKTSRLKSAKLDGDEQPSEKKTAAKKAPAKKAPAKKVAKKAEEAAEA
jgi:hypothetical protein